MLRGKFLAIACGVCALLSVSAWAQSTDDVPLGDVARSYRAGEKPPDPNVIDNDNLTQVMDQAKKVDGDGKPVFSFTGGKTFEMDSPDGTCSLSFNSNATALISDENIIRELPQSEIAKLDGPAKIDKDTLEVSIYNGTAWNLTEITVGLTVVRHDSLETAQAAQRAGAQIVDAAMREDEPDAETPVKRSDSTVLFHMQGSAAPLRTTVFHEIMASAMEPGEDWHWAIVEAKGTRRKAADAPAPQIAPSQATVDPQLAIAPQNTPKLAPTAPPQAAVIP